MEQKENSSLLKNAPGNGTAYQKLYRMIKYKIASGELPPGRKLPTEQKFFRIYHGRDVFIFAPPVK